MTPIEPSFYPKIDRSQLIYHLFCDIIKAYAGLRD